jgi:alpha-tubulin suppressor-like RCC1 family protein
VGGALRFTSLSAGSFYTCGVATSGAGHCWGSNQFGQLGDGTTAPSAAPRLVAGGHRFQRLVAKRASGRPHTCGLTVDGQALCWGWESEALGRGNLEDTSRPGAVVGGLTFRALSAGFSHTCGITTRGDVYCWGDDRYGQLGDGATAARITPGLVPLPP